MSDTGHIREGGFQPTEDPGPVPESLIKRDSVTPEKPPLSRDFWIGKILGHLEALENQITGFGAAVEAYGSDLDEETQGRARIVAQAFDNMIGMVNSDHGLRDRLLAKTGEIGTAELEGLRPGDLAGQLPMLSREVLLDQLTRILVDRVGEQQASWWISRLRAQLGEARIEPEGGGDSA